MTPTAALVVNASIAVVAGLALVCRWYPRPPDEIIGNGTELMRRWRLTPRPRGWAKWIPVLYLHCLLRGDNDPDKHDHPCDNASLVLGPGYLEQMADDTYVWRGPGAVVFRRAETPHRIAMASRCWTLWVCGRARRDWGFHCPKGWVSHREYFKRSAVAAKKGC